ncbi:hypothetical protein ACWGLF_30980 [Streptomyces puniciscabiei]
MSPQVYKTRVMPSEWVIGKAAVSIAVACPAGFNVVDGTAPRPGM